MSELDEIKAVARYDIYLHSHDVQFLRECADGDYVRWADFDRLLGVAEEMRKDAQRYEFCKKHGAPKPTRGGGRQLWYHDRLSDCVEIVRDSFDGCIDACMEPAIDAAREDV